MIYVDLSHQKQARRMVNNSGTAEPTLVCCEPTKTDKNRQKSTKTDQNRQKPTKVQ